MTRREVLRHALAVVAAAVLTTAIAGWAGIPQALPVLVALGAIQLLVGTGAILILGHLERT